MFTSGPFLRVEAFQTVGTDLNKWVDNFLTKDAATKSGIEKTTVTIGDTQWIKFTYQDKTNPESWSVGVDYIALKNGDIFRVSYSKSLPENDALFEKMVHSIAFTPLIVQKIETPQTPKELAQDANYYYVPEMRLRFKKIVGFTPLYTAGTNSVHFTSKELNEGVKGTVFSDCATDLSSLWIVSANEEDPIGSFKVKALSNEKSLWGSGHQAPCWYDPTDAGMSSQSLQEKYAKDSGYIAYSKQGELFGKFIASVELY
jgi:hypothetical protein